MGTYDQAIQVVLMHEGGWVDNPADPGAETNWGISTLIIKRENISAQELGIDPVTMFQPGYLKPMKVDAAKEIYKRLFWDKYGYDGLHDWRVATKIFDCGVNCGPSRAHVMAQKAVNALKGNLVVDGALGPASMAAINALSPESFLDAMVGQMDAYYQDVVKNHPSEAIFLKNWLHRAAWIG